MVILCGYCAAAIPRPAMACAEDQTITLLFTCGEGVPNPNRPARLTTVPPRPPRFLSRSNLVGKGGGREGRRPQEEKQALVGTGLLL